MQEQEIIINIILTKQDEVDVITIILTEEDKEIREFLNQYESEEEKANAIKKLLLICIAKEKGHKL